MDIKQIKDIVEQQTGVPASFLTGETMEENLSQAKALLAYKREQQFNEEKPKTTKEKFAEWFNSKPPFNPFEN